ncbi:MAG: type IV toxin-antitoxin system AbiEi family antitoxin [bacterium]
MDSKIANTSLLEWIENLQSRGRNSFSLEELKKAPISQSETGIERSLDRLLAKKKIVSIRKGYYLIVSPEYSSRGILPADLFIDGFMKFLDRKYYVGLLNAAAIHGAAHQKPQEYFVVTELPALRPTIKRGLKINYVSKKNINLKFIEQRKTAMGYLNISSPALTAVDLIQFEHRIGGLNRAATILNELVDEMHIEQWSEDFLNDVPNSSIQRLGYLMENVLRKIEHANYLFSLCAQLKKKFFRLPLKSKGNKRGSSLNNRWKIVPNIEIEIDK